MCDVVCKNIDAHASLSTRHPCKIVAIRQQLFRSLVFTRFFKYVRPLIRTDKIIAFDGSNDTRRYCTQRFVESVVPGNDVNVAVIYAYECLSRKGKRIVSRIDVKEREIEEERLLRENICEFRRFHRVTCIKGAMNDFRWCFLGARSLSSDEIVVIAMSTYKKK